LAEQALIDYVYLSHSHLDHVKGLPLLLDNVLAGRQTPVEIIASAGTAAAIANNLFNGLLWPDFGKIPSPEHPTMHIQVIAPATPLTVGGYELQVVPVHHSIECHGVLVTTKSGSLAYTGDTGPTEAFWQMVNAAPKLRAVICEVSFPNEMEGLARRSGHFTPAMLGAELAKYAPQSPSPILVTHMKPGQEEKLKAQLAELNDARIVVLRLMDELDL
jgi:cAMP phosphodiesterase